MVLADRGRWIMLVLRRTLCMDAVPTAYCIFSIDFAVFRMFLLQLASSA